MISSVIELLGSYNIYIVLYLLIHVIKEFLSNKSRTRNDHSLYHVEVDVPDDGLDALVIEFVQALLVLADISSPLSRNGYLHFGPGDCHAACHQALKHRNYRLSLLS